MKLYPAYISILFFIITGCDTAEITNVTILENGYYFNSEAMIPFAELVIAEGKIKAINKEHTKTQGNRINISGKYIVPGFTDAHVHLMGSPTKPYTMIPPAYNTTSSLFCGVTTVIDLFFDEYKCRTFKDSINSKPNRYATVLLSGPILTAPKGHGTEYGLATRTITSVQEAKQITNEVIDNGVDVIKLVYQAYSGKYAISKDMLEAIVATAHARNVKVFAHVNVAKEAMDCIDANVDVLAHIPQDTLTKEHINRIKQSGILTIPTLSVYTSVYEGYDAGYFSDSLLRQTANPSYLLKFPDGKAPDAPYPAYKQYSLNTKHNMRQLIKNKLPVAAGTDAGNFAVFCGYSLHEEIRQYVKLGMTPAEALNSATKTIYTVLPGIKTGVIQPGYDADLMILNKNPLEDINNTKNINTVYHKGVKVNRTR